MEQRKIKFRGRSNNNIWFYGSYVTFLPKQDPFELTPPCREIEIVDDSGKGRFVNPFTVGQYIGMRDKNGEEIYEGDIVYVRMRDGSDCYCVIGFDEELLGFGIMDEYAYRSKMQGRNRNFDNGIMHRLYKDSLIFEVRGNIHDNPELIKVED